MKPILVFCVFAVFQTTWSSINLKVLKSGNKHLSDVNKCLSRLHERMGNTLTTTLSGIVGVGWDDLTNTITLPVYATKFDECQTTPDGHFLLPDNVLAMPIQEVFTDRSARSYKSYEDVEKETIRADRQETSSFVGGGTFSVGNQNIKKHFSHGNSIMMEVKIGYKAFTFIAEAEELDAAFQIRINEIVDSLERGHPILAKYQAECLIRDYGTHVVNKALTGASMKYIAFVKTEELHSHHGSMSKMESEAAATFFGLIGGGEKTTSENHNQAKTGFEEKLQYSKIETKGGSDVRKVLNSQDDGALKGMDNIVGLEHEGAPIYLIIHKSYFPASNHNSSTFLNVQNLVFTATKEYYEANTVRGCTDPTASNFEYEANFNDGSCIASQHGFLFDGTFQRCDSRYINAPAWTVANFDLESRNKQYRENYTINHPLTQQTSCPEGYDEILLRSTTLQKPNNYSVRTHAWYGFTDLIFEVECQTFWCRRSVDTETAHSGALFGGFVIDGQNTITNTPGCPVGFKQISLFENIILCVSYNYDADKQYTVPFGGFYSCETSEKQCPSGYKANLLKIVNNCAVFYCISADLSYTEISRVIRPPFVKFSDAMAENEIQLDPK